MKMTEKEVLEVIEQARRDGRTALSLRYCGLTSLPAAIGGLQTIELTLNQGWYKTLRAMSSRLTSNYDRDNVLMLSPDASG